MAQLFPASANIVSKASIVFIAAVVGVLALVALQIFNSAYFTNVTVARQQPIQFSHQHHVTGLGIDCRYCHSSVQRTSFADIPPTHTCMTCHSQVWTNAPILEPVRASYRTNVPLKWLKVHDTPDFVFFNHSIHVAKGVGCSTCHGRVDQMQQISKFGTLYMQWCLDCHKAPQKFVRPQSEIFNMAWVPPANQEEEGLKIVAANHTNVSQLINCSICHR